MYNLSIKMKNINKKMLLLFAVSILSTAKEIGVYEDIDNVEYTNKIIYEGDFEFVSEYKKRLKYIQDNIDDVKDVDIISYETVNNENEPGNPAFPGNHGGPGMPIIENSYNNNIVKKVSVIKGYDKNRVKELVNTQSEIINKYENLVDFLKENKEKYDILKNELKTNDKELGESLEAYIVYKRIDDFSFLTEESKEIFKEIGDKLLEYKILELYHDSSGNSYLYSKPSHRPLIYSDVDKQENPLVFMGSNNKNVDYSSDSVLLGNSNTTTSLQRYLILGSKNKVDKNTNTKIIGNDNNVYGENNLVFGDSNNLGESATNFTENNIVIGSNITIDKDTNNSIVIGNESTAVSNGVSIGSEKNKRKIHFLEDGEVSENSNEAINGSQLYALSNAKDEHGINIDVDAWRKKLKIGEGGDSSELNAAIAGASAIANLPQVSSNKKFSVGIGTGVYKKQYSVAVGISGQDKDRRFVYKLSTAVDSKLNFIFGAGININFGDIDEKKPESTIANNNNNSNYTENKYENQNLKDELNRLTKRIKELEEKIEEKENLNIQNTINEIKYRLDGYSTDVFELTVEQKKVLDDLILKLKDKEVVLIGYADSTGSEKYNLNLALNRAKSVKTYLENNGVKIKEISSLGYNKMFSNNLNENRIVEIIVK